MRKSACLGKIFTISIKHTDCRCSHGACVSQAPADAFMKDSNQRTEYHHSILHQNAAVVAIRNTTPKWQSHHQSMSICTLTKKRNIRIRRQSKSITAFV